jgi:hypothetical protein
VSVAVAALLDAQAFFKQSDSIMKLSHLLCSLALAQSLLFGAAHFAMAAPDDYEFKVIESALPQGDGAILTVAVTDLRTQAPVTDAVIFATRLDMAPDGMATMTTPVAALASDVPGQYRFKADLGMAGAWRFSIAVHLDAETEVIRREIILRVTP